MDTTTAAGWLALAGCVWLLAAEFLDSIWFNAVGLTLLACAVILHWPGAK